MRPQQAEYISRTVYRTREYRVVIITSTSNPLDANERRLLSSVRTIGIEMFDLIQQHEEGVERLMVPLRRSNQYPPYPYCVVRPPSSLPQHQGYFRSWNATTTTRIIDIYPRLNGPYILYHLHCISSRKKRNRTRWMTTTTIISTAFPTFTRILLQPQSLQTTTTTTIKTTTQLPQMFHSILSFLPDFTEHPKPKKHKPKPPPVPPPPSDDGSNGTGSNDNNDDSNNNNNDITFLHDFIAGGVAGSASVIVGHPFDTIKVRLQTSTNATTGILASISEFGGVTSLFRGMTAPLGAAAIINAIVFGSYGFSSRLYDKFITIPALDATDADAEEVSLALTHDPWQKSLSCGAFAGFVQCFVICPLEHIKCRLQIQPKKSKKPPVTNSLTKTPNSTIPAPATSIPEYYNGPIDAVRKIATQHGIHRLYQGWCSTLLREVPAFGLYFCTYDYLKDVTNTLLIQYWKDDTSSTNTTTNMTPHTWIASAIAGGLSGSLTWAIVYPVDLIKSHIQTRSLTTPYTQLRLFHVGRSIVQQHGVKYLFRGLNITLIRALPVNGTIFPVYEFTLKQITLMGY